MPTAELTDLRPPKAGEAANAARRQSVTLEACLRHEAKPAGRIVGTGEKPGRTTMDGD